MGEVPFFQGFRPGFRVSGNSWAQETLLELRVLDLAENCLTSSQCLVLNEEKPGFSVVVWLAMNGGYGGLVWDNDG